jgi:WD40 repeat protein
MSSGKDKIFLNNPFPGLRPYSTDEKELFFGREAESPEILTKLLANRFLAVTGAPGSGKTSLINCIIIPGLRAMTGAGEKGVKVLYFSPGADPLAELVKVLMHELSSLCSDDECSELTGEIINAVEGSAEKVLRKISGDGKTKLLIVADRFGDIFSSDIQPPPREKQAGNMALINILTAAVSMASPEVFVVVAMDAGQISACSQFKALTRLINNSNYVVPWMGHDYYRDVAEKPVIKAGAVIDDELTEVLAGDAGKDPGTLPLLQHALMRTWEQWEQSGYHGNPLGITDYRIAGGVRSSVSLHGDEIYGHLDENEKQICEKIFKAITGKGSDNKAIRRPLSFSSLQHVTGCTADELKAVTGRFSDPSVSFLTPGSEVVPDGDTIIDLSYECLINSWERLRSWVDEEAASVRVYLFLSEASSLFQQGRRGLLEHPDLKTAIEWRNRYKPALEWAQRYDPAFERAMVYLRTSEKEYSDKENRKYLLRRQKTRRNRILSGILGGTALLASILTIFALFMRYSARNRLREAEAGVVELAARKDAAEQYAAIVLKNTVATDSVISAMTSHFEETQRLLDEKSNLIALVENEISAERGIRTGVLLQYDSVVKEKRLTDNSLLQVVTERDETQRRRMLAVARSMSLRSLKIEEPIDLRTLLAYQAYLFNSRNDGLQNDADIYHGLYQVAKEKGHPYLESFEGHSGAITGIAYVPGRKEFFTSGTDGRVIKWDMNGNKTGLEIIWSDGDIADVLAVSPDSGWLACGGRNSTIRLIPVEGTGLGYELKGHSGRITSLAFSYDGEYLYSSAHDGKVFKWNLRARTSTDITTGEKGIISVDLSFDGRNLAGITSDGGAVVWDQQNGRPVFSLGPSERRITSLRFQPGGNRLAAGYDDGLVEIWDTRDGSKIWEARAHEKEVTVIRFNGGKSQMATAGRDGTLKLWDTGHPAGLPVVFSDNAGPVVAIEFSPDGNLIVSATESETDNLKARPASTDVLAGDISRKLTRNFTRGEWMAYVGDDIEYEETVSKSDFNILIKELK